MGLSESKAPFESDGGSQTPKIEKEIGICPMWDPRSPNSDFERTPVFCQNERAEIRDHDIGSVVGDPRSPSCEITRTPVGVECKKSATDNDSDIYSELRVQLERLQIYDGGLHNTTASTDNLGNDSESIDAVTQQKTVLKLLDDESAPNTVDFLWLPNTPPCPKSRSTPREVTPATPESCVKETDGLIKRRKPSSKKQHRSQKGEKLQKKVLKKALGEQATRSPLAERNAVVAKDAKQSSGKAKSTPFVKYRKYNSLDESFNDSFTGKENEHIVW